MIVEKTLLTADELFRMPHDGMRHELVRGELRAMPPSGKMHGAVAMRFAGRLCIFVEPRGPGEVFAAETGFAYSDIMPDLLVEVVSPGASRREVEGKVRMWLEAGVRLVFVAWIRTRTVSVYESSTQVRVLTVDDVLDGGDVLPGFSCPFGSFSPGKPPPLDGGEGEAMRRLAWQY
jgi:Uma2 family endonuclease